MKSRTGLICLALAAVVALPGCFSFQRTYPEKQLFCLTSGVDLAPCHPGRLPAALMVRPLAAAPLYTGTSFVYRKSAFRYETDYVREFAVPARDMITHALEESLAGMFRSQEKSGSTGDTLLVSGKLLEICGDFTDTKNRVASLVVRITVTEGKQDETPLLIKTYRFQEPVPDASSDALIAGWNAGVEALATILYTDICGLYDTP